MTVPVRPVRRGRTERALHGYDDADPGGERHPGTVHRQPVNGVRGQPGLERGVLTRRTGMHLPSQLSLAAWQRIGRQMYVIADSSAWWWGDWLVFGADRFPDRYRRAIAETSLDYQTLRNYAWVARRFTMSRRRDALSFQHHVVVAPLPDAEQDVWLARAEENGWSRNELRRRLRGEQQSAGTRSAAEVYRLNVDRDRQDRWRQAALRANNSLTDWIVVCLDRAADELLERRDGTAIPPPGPM